MVRAYILTERERKLAKRYLETGDRLETLNILLHHLKRDYSTLKSDIQLIENLLEKKGKD